MELMHHPKGNYTFLTGIAPYSSGVAAMTGYEIVHVIMRNPLPYRKGFGFIDDYLKTLQRPRQARCAIQLRIPQPFSFDGFSEFNRGYLDILDEWELPVDGINPVASTNVSPEVRPPGEAMLYAFSYTAPLEAADVPPTFIIAGAGELRVKETDRIKAMVLNLTKVGVRCRELPDGLEIEGSDAPLAGTVDAFGDHRIAMVFGVLGAQRGNDIHIEGRETADVSYPGFWSRLEEMRHGR